MRAIFFLTNVDNVLVVLLVLFPSLLSLLTNWCVKETNQVNAGQVTKRVCVLVFSQ